MTNAIMDHRDELEKKHYVRKADPKQNYWFDFSRALVNNYRVKYGDEFCLIIYGSSEIAHDFFVLPFGAFKHIFTENNLAHDSRNRWIGSIKYNELRVTNSSLRLDISAYYANLALIVHDIQNLKSPSLLSEEEHNDYAIENRKIEIQARQKQSLFRRRVLGNFNYRCCLTEVHEEDLLIASHIIPWSHSVATRLDPRNGLCLFAPLDTLFDNGYFSLSDDLVVIITPKLATLSPHLKQMLFEINEQKIHSPVEYQINLEYLNFHREHVFKK